MTRIQLTDSVQEAVIKLVDGNPGAVTVCAEILKHGAEIDPDCAHPMLHVLDFDDMGIYGSEIWMLYKDVCGTYLANLLAVLRGKQLGYITTRDIRDAIKGERPLDIENIKEKVAEFLPNFKMDWEPQTEVSA